MFPSHDPAVVEPNEINVIGRVDLNGHDLCKRVYSKENISATIPTGQSGNTIPKILEEYRIRKLTPYECLILMGLTHEQAMILINSGISNSQIYKMAGNSIVVQCMRFLKKIEAIDILNEDKPKGQLSLF
jgi:DNA (cytosine-5)-methyltransferase 1